MKSTLGHFPSLFLFHQDKVEERNADYAKIMRNLKFKNTSTAAAGDGGKIAAAAAGIVWKRGRVLLRQAHA